MNICLAGNVMVGPRVLASVEYGCVNAGAKLVMIMAHTGSAVFRSIVDHACGIHEGRTGEHFQFLVESVNKSISLQERQDYLRYSQEERASFCDEVARRHVINSIESIRAGSHTMAELIDRGEVGIIASMYNTLTGTIEFMNDSAVGFDPTEASTTEATAR
jgi:carbonic anhydrase